MNQSCINQNIFIIKIYLIYHSVNNKRIILNVKYRKNKF